MPPPDGRRQPRLGKPRRAPPAPIERYNGSMQDSPPGFQSRLTSAFVSRFGTLLLLFGALLLGLGGLMQLSRALRMSAVEEGFTAPSFDASLVAASGTDSAPNSAAGQPTPSPSPAPIPERIEIPAVNIDTEIVEVGWEARIVNGANQGNVWQTADYAAGLHLGSAGLGEPGNTVISGHNNIAGAVFGELHVVEPGDIVYLTAQGTQRAYEVESKFVLWEEGASPERRSVNAQWIAPTPDERLTLVSCYPPWGNTHRVIVVARPVAGEALPDLSEGEAAR